MRRRRLSHLRRVWRYTVAAMPSLAAPHDRFLWCLVKGEQRAEAFARLIEGLGHDLRFLHNGELRTSQLYKEPAQLETAAAAKRTELLAKGWADPNSLGWGR